MKHIFILALTLMVSIATSCTKDLEAPTPTQSNDPYVIISLEDSQMGETRSFFDDNLSGESWERAINNVSILVCYEDDNGDMLYVLSELSSDEVTNMKSAKIALSGANEGDIILVLAAANMEFPADLDDPDNINSNFNKTLCDIDEYNGAFEVVSTSSKKPDNFEMKCTTLALLEGDVTSVPLTLTRQVAKVAIQTSISDNFNNPDYYPGALRIDNIEVESYASYYDDTPYYIGSQESYLSSNTYNNLYYLYHSYTNNFTINATYDIDGDFTTTEDQSTITYPFNLVSSNNYPIEVIANYYYRANITINGLNRQEIEVTFSVADWEDTDDQNVDIG